MIYNKININLTLKPDRTTGGLNWFLFSLSGGANIQTLHTVAVKFDQNKLCSSCISLIFIFL